MKKKDFGFVEKILPVLLSTGIVFGFVLCSGHFMELFRDREGMNQVARKYLLEMETVGYLPAERLETLVADLGEYGLTEITLNETTTTPVSYGQSIQLDVKGMLKTDVYLGIPFVAEAQKELTIPIHICLHSTAKH